jgi:hypothetical protein
MAGAAPCDGGSEEESRYDGQRAFHCSMYTTRESALSRTDAQGSFRNTGPGERVAPRSESLSLDALDEEVVPVLNTLIHVYVRDVDRVAEEFGVAVDEEGLAGRETALVDPDGNRLRVATRRV